MKVLFVTNVNPFTASFGAEQRSYVFLKSFIQNGCDVDVAYVGETKEAKPECPLGVNIAFWNDGHHWQFSRLKNYLRIATFKMYPSSYELESIIDGLIDALNYNMSEEEAVFSLNGATNIFNYPEFNDIIKAKSFLNMIEKKETIDSMLKSKGIQKDNVNIIIGSDNDLELAKDCSIVTATYNIDKDLVGKISFIGPTRMDYARIYAIVNYINLLFNKK